MSDRLEFLESVLEDMYYEHVDSFTYMMETPYTFNYFCEMYHSELYEEYLVLKYEEFDRLLKREIVRNLYKPQILSEEEIDDKLQDGKWHIEYLTNRMCVDGNGKPLTASS